MNVETFNNNTPRRLAEIVASGQPEPVTYYRRDYTVVAPAALFHELLEVAGEKGEEVLRRHRQQSEPREAVAS